MHNSITAQQPRSPLPTRVKFLQTDQHIQKKKHPGVNKQKLANDTCRNMIGQLGIRFSYIYTLKCVGGGWVGGGGGTSKIWGIPLLDEKIQDGIF